MRTLAVVNMVVLAAAGAWLATLTLPIKQALRVRNAFLLRRGEDDDFGWTPARVPHHFRTERKQPPESIAAAVHNAGMAEIASDWTRALAIVELLIRHNKADAPIRADLATTYSGILAGRGYCADYVRVFLAAAPVAGLFCRQWAFSFDGFGSHGHTVVEIWDRQHSQWRLLDVHNNVYAVKAGTEEPLDALAVRDALCVVPQALEFVQAAPGRLGFRYPHKLIDYYRRGAGEWYLWFGNDVVSRERSGFLGLVARVSPPLAHRLASVVSGGPLLVVATTPDNVPAIRRMEALRRRVTIVAGLIVSLIALLVLQGIRHV